MYWGQQVRHHFAFTEIYCFCWILFLVRTKQSDRDCVSRWVLVASKQTLALLVWGVKASRPTTRVCDFSTKSWLLINPSAEHEIWFPHVGRDDVLMMHDVYCHTCQINKLSSSPWHVFQSFWMSSGGIRRWFFIKEYSLIYNLMIAADSTFHSLP